MSGPSTTTSATCTTPEVNDVSRPRKLNALPFWGSNAAINALVSTCTPNRRNSALRPDWALVRRAGTGRDGIREKRAPFLRHQALSLRPSKGRRYTLAPAMLLVASNRGPVTFEQDVAGHVVARRGAGGLVTALTGALQRSGGLWIAS